VAVAAVVAAPVLARVVVTDAPIPTGLAAVETVACA